MVLWRAGYIDVLYDERFQTYLFDGPFLTAVISTLFFSFSANFVRMISRKMGQGMLINYIRGTYYTPVHQARIIMFINVVDSKKIVNDLGPHNLQRFLNDLFYDLTDPVISNQGIIYEYIEDLVVITWAMDEGLRDANCVRTFFDFKKTIEINTEKYLDKYGIAPKIKASLHTGSVVRAEIGEVKTQIVFHGDTMNTTARILSKCNQLKTEFLASEQLVRMIGLPRIYEKISVGEIALRGKQEPLKLFEIIDKI
jgi:adenylate cyclase